MCREVSKKSILRELWKETFGDSDDYLDLVFEHLYTASYALMCDRYGMLIDTGQAEEVAAGLLGIPYRFIDTASGIGFRGLYLCGLATRPAYRKKGLMGKLMKEIEDRAAEEGLDFLFLIPADDHLRSYYEKAGFTSAFKRIRAKIKAENLYKEYEGVPIKTVLESQRIDAIQPVFDDEYLHIARAENEASGGQILKDENGKTEIFVEDVEDGGDKIARIRYYRAKEGYEIKKLLSLLASRFDSIEFLIPKPAPEPLSSVNVFEDTSIHEEDYAMLKPLYENPKFTNETSVDLKKSILVNTPITTWLMLD